MKQRTWLITGVSSGLGKALSEAVIRNGDFVIGTFRKQEQVVAFNEQYKDHAYGVLMDLSEVDSIEGVVASIAEKFGRIDVLVNNAGVGFVGAVEESTISEVRSVFETNVFGTLRLTQCILPIMRSKKEGHIIQISSHGGVRAFAGFGIYNSSKFALEGFSEALALEVAPLGIRVSIVEPGPFRTNFAHRDSLQQANETIADYNTTAGSFRAKLYDVHGKQEGDPEKAANAIIDLTQLKNPPLRLPLGKIALATMGGKVELLKADIEAAKEIAAKAVF